MGSVVLHVGHRVRPTEADPFDPAEVLRGQGFAVASVFGTDEALAATSLMELDAVLIDVIPAWAALEAVRAVHRAVTTPIVVVLRDAAARDGSGECDEVVHALEAGADDVIVDLDRRRELVARVRAVIRRRERAATREPSHDPSEVFQYGSIRLDDAQHTVTVDGREVELPLRQYNVLRVLMTHAGQVVPREVLVEAVWGTSLDPNSKTLNVHIKRLRAQLEEDRRRPCRIVTVRGVGYRLTDGSPRVRPARTVASY